jgi:hypothetical protein
MFRTGILRPTSTLLVLTSELVSLLFLIFNPLSRCPSNLAKDFANKHQVHFLNDFLFLAAPGVPREKPSKIGLNTIGRWA